MSIWLIWTIWTSLSALPRKAVKFNYSLTLVVVTHTQGHGLNLRTQYIVKSVFSTVTFQINIAQMWVVYDRFVHRMIQTRMSRRKRWHLKSPGPSFLCLKVTQWLSFTSGHPIDSHSWQSGLPFPRYNLTLKIQGQRQRSKVPQSTQRPDYSLP